MVPDLIFQHNILSKRYVKSTLAILSTLSVKKGLQKRGNTALRFSKMTDKPDKIRKQPREQHS